MVFFVSLWVVIGDLRLTEKNERKKNKMDIFVMELLDYVKRWKNLEGSFTIGKQNLIVLMAEAWLRSIFDARTPIPYVWDAI